MTLLSVSSIDTNCFLSVDFSVASLLSLILEFLMTAGKGCNCHQKKTMSDQLMTTCRTTFSLISTAILCCLTTCEVNSRAL